MAEVNTAKISYPKFVHLRLHSSYSLSEGAVRPEEIGKICAKHNMPAVAVTDSGNLFGLLEISTYCAKYGVQAIPAVEANFAFAREGNKPNAEYPKIVLLAQNEKGYKNLLKLVSDSYLNGEDHTKPIIYHDELVKFNKGLLCLSGGCNGVLDTLIGNNQAVAAQKVIDEFKKIFGDRFYIELNRLGQEKQASTELVLLELAEKNNIPLVATNNVMFVTEDMFEAQDVLMCIAAGVAYSDENRRHFCDQNYFKSQSEMMVLFADIPEALENTVNIAKRCSYMTRESKPALPKFPTHEGRSEDEEMHAVAFTGLRKRLGITDDFATIETIAENYKPYYERLDFELSVIAKMGFSGYFLCVSDFIRWAKENDIPVGPGRGSGAGSVAAWAMEITNLDPLRFGLLFERFLNPERVSMPDFDIDFCQERRSEVIEYVQAKYGSENVAQIITFGKLQARAVIRDVGRVLQIPYSKVDRICKIIPFNPIDPVTLEKAIELDPELQRERDTDEVIAKLLDIGLRLEGMHRHASTHAAGVVIGSKPLVEILPLYSDGRSQLPTTQYSMKYCEAAGLVKFDFLGLKTLTLINKTIKMIEKNEGVKIDIDNIPLNDELTFKMLAEGKGTGVFQMESAGMRDSMRKMRVDSIEDIIALISLYRPGPMENIPNYIACKLGKKKPDYMHPMLEVVLKETYGVIIYQEQVMQIAQILAGYTLGGADMLRRAMGKKIKAEMDAQCEKFVSGAVGQGVDKKKAEEIFELVAKFAGYGFNKSHAAAYAVIGYQTAYLKAHYPAEFLCCSMNQELTDTDKILMFREESRRMGLKILPPDINKSDALFKVEKLEDGIKAVRYALAGLKNVGGDAMLELQKERAENGEFKDMDDFIQRVSSSVMNKRQIESLAACGALDKFNENRRQIFEEAQNITRFSQVLSEEKNSAQESLFGGADLQVTQKIKLAQVEPWGSQEKVYKEFQAIGFYLDNHPVAPYLKILPVNRFCLVEQLDEKIPLSPPKVERKEGASWKDGGGWKERPEGFKVYLIGVPNRVVQRTANGRRFAYFSFSDPTGMTEINIFNDDLINKGRDLLEGSTPLVVLAEARRDEGGIRLIAEDIIDLNEYLKTLKSRAEIMVNEEGFDDEEMANISKLFANDNAAVMKIPVSFIVKTKNNFEIKIKLDENYFIDAAKVFEGNKVEENRKFELKILFN